MKLKDIYRKMCFDQDFLSQYSETGTGKYGKIFAFQNTNYRLLLSFIKNYHTFKVGANGVDRSLWELNQHHGQEKLKQHTVNMIKARFFSKNERTYYNTRKGEVLEKLTDNFTDEEKWILLYLLLIDSYFDNIPCYILKRTADIYDDFYVYLNSKDKINNMILDFIQNSKKCSIEELFKHDYLYFDSFYLPFKKYDFLANYTSSNLDEKEELYDYIINNYKELKELIRCSKSEDEEESARAKNILLSYNYDVISSKYRPTGVYNKNMVVDNAKILFMSNYINNTDFKDFSDFIHLVINKYTEIEDIDSGKIYQFIFGLYKDIYEISYINIFNPEYDDGIPVAEDLTIEEENEILEEAQKTAIIEDLEQRRKSSSVLKKKALERADYKCELEDFCDCSSHYFTNKKTGKNYVELHHLIPREFSNDFEKSIEQIENYVSLCPRCHRFIHFAVDRERKMALHHLYLKRIGSLNIKGIGIEETQLKQYYRIEE